MAQPNLHNFRNLPFDYATIDIILQLLINKIFAALYIFTQLGHNTASPFHLNPA